MAWLIWEGRLSMWQDLWRNFTAFLSPTPGLPRYIFFIYLSLSLAVYLTLPTAMGFDSPFLTCPLARPGRSLPSSRTERESHSTTPNTLRAKRDQYPNTSLTKFSPLYCDLKVPVRTSRSLRAMSRSWPPRRPEMPSTRKTIDARSRMRLAGKSRCWPRRKKEKLVQWAWQVASPPSKDW